MKALNAFYAKEHKDGSGPENIAEQMVIEFPSHVQQGITYQERTKEQPKIRVNRDHLQAATGSDTADSERERRCKTGVLTPANNNSGMSNDKENRRNTKQMVHSTPNKSAGRDNSVELNDAESPNRRATPLVRSTSYIAKSLPKPPHFTFQT